MRPALALVVVLLSCGRSDVLDGLDAPAATTPQPIETCVACRTSPPVVDTPMQTTPGGKPLHWATCAGCVRVSFGDTISPSDAITLLATVKAWQRAVGESLCLKLDTTASPPLTASDQHRIHVARADLGSTLAPLTTVTFNQQSGRLQHAEVLLGEAFAADRQLAAGLGRALGLATGREVDSAVTNRTDGLTAPGPADLTTLQSMYGATPSCITR